MILSSVQRWVLGAAVLGTAAAGLALFGAAEPAQAQAGAAGAAAAPACQCSAAVEVQGGGNPMSPRGWITNCQCGAQSCAVLNSTVLQCSR